MILQFFIWCFLVPFSRNTGNGEVYVEKLAVEPVNYGPYQHFILPNSNITLTCIYTDINPNQVEWVIPLGEPDALSGESKKTVVEKKSLEHGQNASLYLIITNTQVEDAGEYECRTRDISAKVLLCVIDPSQFVDYPSNITIDEGRSHTLTCQARGKPEPALVWLRNGEEIKEDVTSTKYRIMTKYTSQGVESLLTITSLNKDDIGQYTCESIQEHPSADNCSLTQTKNITVFVNYAPTFENRNQVTVYGGCNRSINLVCNASGYPVPLYRWFHIDPYDFLYEYTKRTKYWEDKRVANLTILVDESSYDKKYICEAKNGFGYAKKIFRLKRIPKPRSPDEITISNRSANYVDFVLKWSKPPIDPKGRLELQYIQREGKEKNPLKTQWKKANVSYLPLEMEESKNVKVKLANLDPGTEYCVRLRFHNDGGYSAWSLPVLVATNSIEEYEKIDIEITAKTKSADDDIFISSRWVYSTFFAGCILVIVFTCVVIMKLI